MRKYFVILIIILILVISSTSLANSNQYMLRRSDTLDAEEIEEITLATEQARIDRENIDLKKAQALENNRYFEEPEISSQEIIINGWFTPQDSDNQTSTSSLLANGESRATLGKPQSGELLETIKIYTRNKNLLVKYNAKLDEQDWGTEATASYDLAESVGNIETASQKMNNFVMRLDGPESVNYDLYYRVYAENDGWLNWVTSDVPVVDEETPIHIESLEVRILPKGANGPSEDLDFSNLPIITAKGYVQEIGWDNPVVGTNLKFGKTGTFQQLEALSLETDQDDLNIEYQVLVQGHDWSNWISNGEGAGTTGQDLPLEAVKIRLSGNGSDEYDLYYRTHIQNYGWLDWTNNGESAGTENQQLRLEGIQLKVLPKSASVPGQSRTPFIYANNLEEGEIIKNINYVRKNKSLPLLTSDKALHNIAIDRVYEVSSNYSHERPNETDFVSIFEDEGYRSDGLIPASGENIVKAIEPDVVIENFNNSEECLKVMTTDYFRYAAFSANGSNGEGISVTLFTDSPSY